MKTRITIDHLDRNDLQRILNRISSDISNGVVSAEVELKASPSAPVQPAPAPCPSGYSSPPQPVQPAPADCTPILSTYAFEVGE